jgi:hypothetical protein
MELEFDKEIDALLRKARSGTVVPAKGTHLDADAIAAFAEGAIPDAARKTYTAHFADCDSCRKALSQVALLNESSKAAAAAAAPAVRSAAPAATGTVPWYRPLFRAPGLAAAFGVLVLALGFGLVYFVTQRSSNTESAVAFDANKASANAVPYAGIDTNSNANAASSMSNAPAANTSANTMSNVSRSAASSAANTSVASNTAKESAPAGGLFGGSASSDTTTAQPSTAAPPPADLPINGRELKELALDKPKTETSAGKNKDEDRRDTMTTRNRALSEDGLARGADTNAKKAVGGPLRAAGPVQNQMQVNTQSEEMAVTRRVGGKTFHNSNGAWYDSAYHGQSTTNVRRGTTEFKNLDSGLRSIANDLGGVVVVVWKDKAYRIQ